MIRKRARRFPCLTCKSTTIYLSGKITTCGDCEGQKLTEKEFLEQIPNSWITNSDNLEIVEMYEKAK